MKPRIWTKCSMKSYCIYRRSLNVPFTSLETLIRIFTSSTGPLKSICYNTLEPSLDLLKTLDPRLKLRHLVSISSTTMMKHLTTNYRIPMILTRYNSLFRAIRWTILTLFIYLILYRRKAFRSGTLHLYHLLLGISSIVALNA